MMKVIGALVRDFIVMSSSRVLSRIFCLGGESILKKFLSHASASKIFLGLLGVLGHAPLENFENIVFRIG